MNEIELGHLDLNLLVTFEVLMREGSVTRTAKHLGRTQSAVSHALGRLRQQLGDPLLVKAGGRMSPTPYARDLVEDIRPILRNIQRVVAPPEPFDPKTSRRVFRVAFPAATAHLMAAITARVQREAPDVAIDWVVPDADAFAAVEAGSIDLAEIGGDLTLPDGVEARPGRPLEWITFARKDHPAAKRWSLEAWQRWPHVKMKIANNTPNPVEDAAKTGGVQRRIGAWASGAASIIQLLQRTDLLGTFPPIIVSEGLVELGLRALEPPVPIPEVPMRFFWSFRLTNDPGSRWFRELVIEVFEQQQKAAYRSLNEVGILKAKRGKSRKSG